MACPGRQERAGSPRDLRVTWRPRDSQGEAAQSRGALRSPAASPRARGRAHRLGPGRGCGWPIGSAAQSRNGPDGCRHGGVRPRPRHGDGPWPMASGEARAQGPGEPGPARFDPARTRSAHKPLMTRMSASIRPNPSPAAIWLNHIPAWGQSRAVSELGRLEHSTQVANVIQFCPFKFLRIPPNEIPPLGSKWRRSPAGPDCGLRFAPHGT